MGSTLGIAQRVNLRIGGEPQLAPDLLCTPPQHPSEPLCGPASRRRRRSDDELAIAVNRDQLDRRQPNLERAPAHGRSEQLADPVPITSIGGRRPTEAFTDLVEVDANHPPPSPAALGEVGLLNDQRAGFAPPSGGLGGFPVLGFWGSLPARAWDAGFSAGFSAEDRPGFAGAASSKSVLS